MQELVDKTTLASVNFLCPYRSFFSGDGTTAGNPFIEKLFAVKAISG
jgi:hypothetical protein